MESVVHDFPHWALVLGKLTSKEMPPKPMKQPPEDAPPAGDRLDRRSAEERGAQECRRSRAGAGPAAQQCRVQLHHPRPDRRGPPSDARVSGRSRQSGRFRQLGRVAHHVAGAAEQVPAGCARGGRSHGAQTGWDSTSRRIRCWSRRTARNTPIQRIVDFYDRQPTDFADYFQAAWRYKHRAALGKPSATLAGIAARGEGEPQVSAP